MGQTTTVMEGVSVRVDLSESATKMLKKQALKLLESTLVELFGELLNDLGLPVQLNLELRPNQAVEPPFLSYINGQATRSSRGLEIGENTTVRRLAIEIANDVYANRKMLISQTNANLIRKMWSSEEAGLCLPGLSRVEFRDYLCMLSKHCFRMDRGSCLQNAEQSSANQWTIERCFGKSVRFLDQIQLVLYHPTQYFKHSNNNGVKDFIENFTTMQDGLFYELGIRFPQIRLEIDDSLEPTETRLQINDLKMPPFQGLSENEFLVNDTVDRLTLLNIKGFEAINPANGSECAIVAEKNDQRQACESAGLTTWGPNGYLVLELSSRLGKHAECFVNEGTLKYDIDLLGEAFPALIKNVVGRFDLPFIAQVLRNLADEEISFRNLRDVLQAMLAIKTVVNIDSSIFIYFPSYGMLPHRSRYSTKIEDLDAIDFAETVRSHQKRYISHKYTRGGNMLVVYLLDPSMESRIAELDVRPLSDDERQEYLEAIFNEVGSLRPSAQNPVVLTLSDVRKKFHDLIEIEFPHLAVLCYEELSPDMSIQPIARIAV